MATSKLSGACWVLTLILCLGAHSEAQQMSFTMNGEGEADASGDQGGGLTLEGNESSEGSHPSGDESPIEAYTSKENEKSNADTKDDAAKGGGDIHLQRPLLLTRHTMEIGGEIGLTSGVNIPHNDPGADATGGGVFFFSPQMGYFVIDQLELLFELNVRVGFGTENPANPAITNWTVVGFAAGAEYVFDFHVICLYIGGLIGANFAISQVAGRPNEPYFTIRVPFGIMFPFNRHVALNAGLAAQFDIYLGDDARSSHIYFPIGYFGIRGFFNIIDGG